MPIRDAQWILRTVIAIAIALSMQIGGVRADVRELRADVREDLRDMGRTSAELMSTCVPSNKR